MLEIIGMSLTDCKAIEASGADRIELVSALEIGGITPSYGLVESVMTQVDLPVAVMLRPHNGNYIYSRDELHLLKRDAEIFASLGVNHVVLGILDDSGLPDLSAIDFVLGNTRLNATFHRAIDESSSIAKSLQRLDSYPPVTHILSSGGPGAAVDNLSCIQSMLSSLQHTTLIVGSGLTTKTKGIITNSLGDFTYDLHAGTGARIDGILSPISRENIQRLRGF